MNARNLTIGVKPRVNGATSVICSAMALLLCIFLGFGKVFFLASLLYLAALAFMAGERVRQGK